MKLNKIISSALAVVMILTAMLAVIPTQAFAAHSPSSITSESKTVDEISVISDAANSYKFNSVYEMFDYEYGEGYLDYVSSAGGEYTLYVNRYTGYVYYQNNKTGEMLTSNPYNMTNCGSDYVKKLTSQIFIQYTTVADSGVPKYMYSSVDSAARAQIKLSRINGGIRVNYTLGDTSSRQLLPAILTAEDFENEILRPALEYFEALVYAQFPVETWEAMPSYKKFVSFFASDTYTTNDVYSTIKEFPVYESEGVVSRIAYSKYFGDMSEVLLRCSRDSENFNREQRTYLSQISSEASALFATLVSHYQCFNPAAPTSEDELKTMNAVLPDTKNGQAFYVFGGLGNKPSASLFKNASARFLAINPDYTFDDMYSQEAKSSGEPYSLSDVNAIFRCTLEYTFNSDGSLSVKLPANSITFDETKYNLSSIAPLQYFGSGDLNDYGYAFIPDGSGSIIEFDEFYTTGVPREQLSVSIYLTTYGLDYCYSYLDNMATRPYEQVTMPVYGVVSTQQASNGVRSVTGKTTMQTGFFAVLEEGSALATIRTDFGGSMYNYGSVYASFNPYPSDKFTYDDGNQFDIVSKSKYTGSYITRYVMLSDPDYTATTQSGFEATYIGMASYYREYLKETGVIEPLRELNEQLPLYLEALGSMEKVEQIMTFPVTVEVPLTTFDNVIDIYNELSAVKKALEDRAKEYEALSVLPGDVNDLEAQKYYALSEEVTNISNINFKLTGFANNGMYYTYPVKLDWESACGGRDGFINLLKVAKEKSQGAANFGIFPEFDFLYINNTALFDGIDNKDNVSKMVDDRYGSKKVYDPVASEFETVYAMIISPDVLEKHYETFLGKYSEYNISSISVSTLGSDLNSNFDRDNSINRDEARIYVESLLDRIVDDYDVMISTGNIYSLKYADHVLDLCIDSTHFNTTSYAIPFAGLVLHSYVNYTGSAMNYSGSPDFDLLHSVENGATLYYIVCYQNTEIMKDDEILNKYYGVDYHTWLESIASAYSKLDWAIGDLQGYEIVDHKLLIAERDIEDAERIKNVTKLLEEFIQLVDKSLRSEINKAYSDMFDNPAEIGRGVKLIVDVDAIVAQAISALNLSENIIAENPSDDIETYEEALRPVYAAFLESLEAKVAEYTDYYNGNGDADPYTVEVSEIAYESAYRYVTDSKATDKDYQTTEYTVNNRQVIMVTYRDASTGDEVKFVLNYNIYSVVVTLDDGTTCTLSQYDMVKIDEEGIHYYG